MKEVTKLFRDNKTITIWSLLILMYGEAILWGQSYNYTAIKRDRMTRSTWETGN